uniref:C-type lectin domain-containing protein n=1 Tax=Oryzias latipes TaxID=8090 RepID=A0A3P9IA90_ORYLA
MQWWTVHYTPGPSVVLRLNHLTLNYPLDDEEASFALQSENASKNYVFINQTMSWSSAQQYCRENYKDLAMIENQEENTEAKNAKPSSDLVWIGLYREPWTWSDGSKSSFRNWLPNTGLNNIDKNQHCITENPQHQWADEFCNIPWVFVCHQGEHLKKY